MILLRDVVSDVGGCGLDGDNHDCAAAVIMLLDGLAQKHTKWLKMTKNLARDQF